MRPRLCLSFLAAVACGAGILVPRFLSAQVNDHADTARREQSRVGYGVQLAIGGLHPNGGNLRSDLERAGYASRPRTQWSVGLDVDATRDHLVFGAGIHAVGSGGASDGPRTQALGGFTTGFTVGVKTFQSEALTIMPFVGGGTLRQTLRLRDSNPNARRDTTPVWSALIANPGSEARVRLTMPAIDVGVRFRRYRKAWMHTPEDFSPITELRIGYVLPVGSLEARMSDRRLQGTNDLGFGGWYIRIGAGIGRAHPRTDR